MARRPRIHFPGALYHVITRGNRIQGIFLDEKDMKKFLAYLVEYKSRRPFRLYAYALMKNHLHLLVEVEEIPLSRIKNTEFPLPDPILLKFWGSSPVSGGLPGKSQAGEGKYQLRSPSVLFGSALDLISTGYLGLTRMPTKRTFYSTIE